MQTPPRVRVEQRGVPLEVGDEQRPVLAALVGIAERVDLSATEPPIPRRSKSAPSMAISSTSMSGPAKPSASTPTWWNCR